MEGRFGLSPNLGWGRAMKSACTTQPDNPQTGARHREDTVERYKTKRRTNSQNECAEAFPAGRIAAECKTDPVPRR